MVAFRRAQRLAQLPPYLFAGIDRLKRQVAARGVKLVNLGIGDPDMPTPPHIIAALRAAADNPAYHRYPDYEGLPAFRAAAATWCRQRFGIAFDPEREIVSLIGSKEGIAHFPVAFVDPGDVVLVPDPGYPVYGSGALFSGGVPYHLRLDRDNGFLPDLESIPAEVARRAKLLWLNYPNNPTGAVAPREFFAAAVRFAERHGIILCHDAAYSEIYYDDMPPASILEIPGAREVAVEFHSLSKTYNMTGWRIGFAVGAAELIAALGQVKTNIDSGIFCAVQEAGIAALTGDQSCVAATRHVYQQRRDTLLAGLARAGLRCRPPPATFYAWVEVPEGFTATTFAARLLEEAGVVTTPGTGFGDGGEGFVRMALTTDVAEIREAVERIARLGTTAARPAPGERSR